jgi:hypothetical protein
MLCQACIDLPYFLLNLAKILWGKRRTWEEPGKARDGQPQAEGMFWLVACESAPPLIAPDSSNTMGFAP